MKAQKTKKGNARARRNRIRTKCARYRTQNRREKNKARRLARHLKCQPSDREAARTLVALYDANPIALNDHRETVLATATRFEL